MTPSITCPRCGRTSHHPEDVAQGWCAACRDYTGANRDMVAGVRVPFLDDLDDPMYFDIDANPITLARWSWLHHPQRFAEYRRVAFDEIDLYAVSTVWLGLDHNFAPVGPPLIFETMVFLAGTPEDMGMHRYATREQALAGHEAICAEIREAQARMENHDEHTHHAGPDGAG